MQAITAPLTPLFAHQNFMQPPSGGFYQMSEPHSFLSQANAIIANLNYLRYNIQS